MPPTDREIMQKALEALDLLSRVPKAKRDYADRAITALRERLAQTEQKPVAWVLEWIEDGEVYASKLYESERRCRYDAKKDADAVCRPLVYGDTSPSKREWQGLTAAEFRKAVDGLEDLEDCWVALEHALKEKNT